VCCREMQTCPKQRGVNGHDARLQNALAKVGVFNGAGTEVSCGNCGGEGKDESWRTLEAAVAHWQELEQSDFPKQATAGKQHCSTCS
jgi:hypothetical protein